LEELGQFLRSAANIRTNFFETFLKFREMRSRPVNLAAARAAPELFVVDLSKRLKLLNYISLRNFLERRIAAKAPSKWGNEAKKIEAANYFYGLFVGILGSRAVTGSNDCMH